MVSKLTTKLEELLRIIDPTISVSLLENEQTGNIGWIEIFSQGKKIKTISIERDSLMQILKDIVKEI